MITPSGAPQTPPGLPPGSALTQAYHPSPTGALGAPAFDSGRAPGIFGVSSWVDRPPNENAANSQADPPPALVAAARALVLRYRRSSWTAESIPEPARRVAVRALRETREALAAGITAEGVQAMIKEQARRGVISFCPSRSTRRRRDGR